MEVYPPRLAGLKRDTAYSAQDVDIQALRTNTRLDDALKSDPSVSLFRRTGSEAANPTIQGVSLRAIAPSGASRALVTLEGVPQNDPFGGWVIWTALPPEGISRVRVVRGAGAGSYGGGALTGVVELEALGARNGFDVLDVSSGQRGNARIAAAGGNSTLQVVASAETTDGYVPVRAGRGDADLPAWLRTYSIQTSWRPDLGWAQGFLQLSAYRELRGAGLAGATSRAEGASVAAILAHAGDNGLGGWRVQAWVRTSDFANTSVSVADDRSQTTPANNQYATPSIGYGLNAVWRRANSDWDWEFGGDARLTTGRAKEQFRYIAGAFTRDRTASGHTLVIGAYGEIVRRQGDWTVTGGARIDGWRQSHAERRERALATGVVTLEQEAPDRSGLVPTSRFAVRYKLNENTFVRASAYASFRPPTLNELHRPFRVGNDVTEANPSLKPERLYGIEAGLGDEGRIKWSATAFYNRLEDPIANMTIAIGPGTFPAAGFIPAGGVLRQRRNLGSVAAHGLELNAAAGITSQLSARAGFSWTHARVKGGPNAPQLDGKRPAQSATVTATGGVSWRPVARLCVDGDIRFEGDRYEDDLNLRRLRPGLTADLRIGYNLGRGAEIYLLAENATDSALEVGETASGIESFAAPRTIRVGFTRRR